MITAELSEVEETELKSLVRRPPGIVIFGQTAQAKATIVNEILGKDILPAYPASEQSIPDSQEENKKRVHPKWRAVRLRYGKKQRVSFCLANSFELVGEVSCLEKTWTTVPLEVLLVDDAVHPIMTEGNDHGFPDRDDYESDCDSSSVEEHSDPDAACTEEDSNNGDKKCEKHNSDTGQRNIDELSASSDGGDKDINDVHLSCRQSVSRQESHNQLTPTEETSPEEPTGYQQKNDVIVEVTLNHPLFNDGAQIIVDEDDSKITLDALVDAFTTDLVPIFVYALSSDVFSKQVFV